MKLLVLGASGQVGRELVGRARALGWQVDGRTHGEVDIAKPAAVSEAFAGDYDAAVNAAAYTAVDRAESEPEAAFRANAEGAGIVAEAAARTGAGLVHISTDYVFDGAAAEPYAEDAEPNPLSVYGASKLEGERRVRAAHAGAAVLRTSWVFGARGPSFVATMLRLGRQENELRVVDDQQGGPTFAGDVAEACLTLASSRHAGVLHLQGRPVTTRFGFAEATFEAARASGAALAVERVRPIRTRDRPTPARRPANSALDCAKIEALMRESEPAWVLPDWRPRLRETVEALLTEPGAVGGAISSHPY